MRLAALQTLLPHRVLSAIVRRAARWTWSPWKSLLIRQVVRRYRVDLDEAAQPDPDAYPHFDAFFTRALKPGARPLDPDPATLLCPADGRISQAGRIDAGRLLQAKGRHFTVAELLADAAAADVYRDGTFVTVYLSPRDYHRVHMPLAGTLRRMIHIPGDLFSVNAATTREVARLFARNERLVCIFETAAGPMALILVGAMIVASIETVWSGLVTPRGRRPQTFYYQDRAPHIELERGAEMGRFLLGSTAIILLPEHAAAWAPTLSAGCSVRMGSALGTWQAASS